MKRNQIPDFFKRRRDSGMTMPEMMVALLISSLMILGVVNIYRYAYKDWNDGMRVERLQQQTQYAMSLLEGDVRKAAVTTVQLASGTTTYQTPMMTTNNGAGIGGYGVIIIEDASTLGIAALDQVNYQLITSNGMLQLQRSDVGTYTAGALVPLSGGLQWKPVISGITTISATLPFTVSTFNLTTYVHQDLSVALMAQAPNNAPNLLSTYAVPLITTLTMGGNAQIQYQVEDGQ
jgi:prepilin-type N-terminal cleavage/methylation domain-containing protein